MSQTFQLAKSQGTFAKQFQILKKQATFCQN